MNRVDYRGAFWFPIGPDELWGTIERFDQFEAWWSWLRTFGADTDGLVAGNALHGTVVPPVPYRLHLDVQLEQCLRPHFVQATVGGDVRGAAEMRIEPVANGTRVSVVWSLTMMSTPLRIAARVAYPLMSWGHGRVVEMAVAGFRQRALDGAA
ncbi:MAG TPA: hypothetical protein VE442_23215 [Jatrophihabitans sp.]|nr:hypothetical protein [Jatrophihabitans sp.]